MTISKIMGCASPTNTRIKNDRYLTPEWCTEALTRVELRNWPGTIWEPCAGEGDIANVLLKHARVVESDLTALSERPHLRQLDFLKTTKRLATAIVSNPPYKYATEFIAHAIRLGIGYHAWLLKADFMCAQRRLELVNELGYPARIWGLTERPDFLGQGGQQKWRDVAPDAPATDEPDGMIDDPAKAGIPVFLQTQNRPPANPAEAQP